jgi:prolyl 4-hydroxylase
MHLYPLNALKYHYLIQMSKMKKIPPFLVFLFLSLLFCFTNASDGNTGDGQCAPSDASSSGQFEITVVNKSRYRADIHWDDGMYGSHMAILDADGGTTKLDTFTGHSFFVTRHGVKEGLFDLETDIQHRYTVSHSGEVFVIPSDASPSNNPCQDRFSICQREAARGACWSSPGWMIVHCCKSCDKDLDASVLIDPKVRCSKERLNITEPAWKPGDLNDLFASWASGEDYKQYEPQVLSSPKAEYGGIDGPWVMTFDNFFSAREAEALIRGGKMAGFERSTDQGAMNALGEREKVVSKTRTSSNAWCIGGCENMPEVKAVSSRIEKITNVPKTNYESFQILEYTNDQFYRSHHDSSGVDKSVSGHRILTFFLYLTDVEEGGETMFNKLDLKVKPKRGRALVSIA